MNKLFNKIAVAFVGMAMAIGVGVAVGSKSEAKMASAATVEGSFERYTSGTLTAGDYLIVQDNAAMKNTIDGGRFQYTDLTITDSKVTNPDGNIVWTLASEVISDKTYWSFYNSAISKYALFGSNNKNCSTNATLSDNGRWEASVTSSVWTFTNKGQSGKTLRKNGTYGFAAYGSSDGIHLYKKADIAVTNVSLNKSEATVGVGGTETLTATITPSNATNKTITWLTSAPGVATVSAGVVTGVAVGSATITALSDTNKNGAIDTGEKYATCAISVEVAVAVTGITLDITEKSIAEEESFTITPTISPADATNKNVNWSTSDASVATVEGGLVTGKSAGSATITATTVDGSFSKTCAVTVTAYVGKTYTKVTSAPADWRGTYLLVFERNATSGEVFDSRMATFDVTEKTLTTTLSSSTITGTKAIDAAAVKIERDDVSDKSRYFALCANGEYLKSGSKTINHQAEKDTSVEVTFDGTALKIGSYYLRYNKTSGQDRFRFGASDYCDATALYKMDYSASSTELTSFVSSFASKTGSVCKTDNTTNVSSLDAQWTLLAGEFATLSVDAQGVLANTTYTHDGETKDSLKDIVDRYDYIYGRHGGDLTDGEFMNRTEANTLVSYARADITLGGVGIADSSATLIIIVISSISLVTIGGYLVLRKRKEY